MFDQVQEQPSGFDIFSPAFACCLGVDAVLEKGRQVPDVGRIRIFLTLWHSDLLKSFGEILQVLNDWGIFGHVHACCHFEAGANL